MFVELFEKTKLSHYFETLMPGPSGHEVSCFQKKNPIKSCLTMFLFPIGFFLKTTSRQLDNIFMESYILRVKFWNDPFLLWFPVKK